MTMLFVRAAMVLLAVTCSLTATAAEPVQPAEGELNKWLTFSGSELPAGGKKPHVVKGISATYPYFQVMRFTLQKGQSYTFEIQYGDDSIRGTCGLYGVDPMSDVDHAPPCPKDHEYLFHLRRYFPGGKYKGSTFGVRANFTVAPTSRQSHAWVVYGSEKPCSTLVRITTPPLMSNEMVEKEGYYEKMADGKVHTGLSRAYPIFWLGDYQTPTGTTAVKEPEPNPAGGGQATGTPPASDKPAGDGTAQLAEAGAQNNAAVEVAYPCRVSAFIDRNDYDTFTFTHKGGPLSVQSAGGLDLVADLFDATGKSVLRAGVEAEPDFTLKGEFPEGTYYLQVRVMHHAGEGAYRLTFGDGGGPGYQEARK